MKLVASILLPLCLIYSAMLIVSYRVSKANAERAAENYLQELCTRYAGDFDAQLSMVERQTVDLSLNLQHASRIDNEALVRYLRKSVEYNSFLSGLAFAFEPHIFSPQRKLYAPYQCRSGAEINLLDISESYDYTTHDWFVKPQQTGNPYWTEPYLGGASGILNASFTYPTYRDGVFIGVAAADLSLEDMTRKLSELELNNGYVFLLSKKGKFISHPNSSWIMKEGLDSIAETSAPIYTGVFSLMQDRQSGVIKQSGSSRTEAQWIVYKTVPTTGWIFAAVVSEEALLFQARRQLHLQLVMMLVGLFIIMILVLLAAHGITKPIRRLTDRAHAITAGDLDSTIPIVETRDEIEELTTVVNHMTAELKEQIKNISIMADARARVESELSIARNIQQSLLPHVFPPFPKRSEFSLYAQMIPARDVAGDFFDFFFLDHDHLVLVIADVSGKGVPAALFMAVTRTLIKTVCVDDTTPSQALIKANQILSCDNDNCMFTTLFIGVYEVSSGHLCYANAGHLPPLLFSKDGSFRILESLGDPALGIVEDYMYKQSCINIEIDDRLVFFTDGVTEASDPEDNLYGTDRLIQLLQDSLDDSIYEVQDRLREDLDRFQAGEQADDITLLFFARKL